MTYIDDLTYTEHRTEWVCLEDQWPTDHGKRHLFYNKTLDIYTVTTLEEIETQFKKFRQNFSEIIGASKDQPPDDPMRFWIENRYEYSHWTELKKPPV